MNTASSDQMAHGESVDAISLFSLPTVPPDFFDELGQGMFEQPVELENVVWHSEEKISTGLGIVMCSAKAVKDGGQ